MTPNLILKLGSAELGEPIYGGTLIFGFSALLLFHTIYINEHFDVGRVVVFLFLLNVAGAIICLFAPVIGIGT